MYRISRIFKIIGIIIESLFSALMVIAKPIFTILLSAILLLLGGISAVISVIVIVIGMIAGFIGILFQEYNRLTKSTIRGNNPLGLKILLFVPYIGIGTAISAFIFHSIKHSSINLIIIPFVIITTMVICYKLIPYIGNTVIFFIWAANKLFGFNSKKRSKNGGNLFEGLDPEAAKRKYRELLKKYHPDNMNGDTEKTTKIINEYRNYSKNR